MAPTRFGRACIQVERIWSRLRGRGLAGAAIAGCLLVLGCGSPDRSQPGLRIRVAPTPPTVGQARIIVQVLGDGRVPVSGTVTGRTLPDGSPGPPQTAVESGPNTLSVAEFDFGRSGPWRMVAEVRLLDGAIVRDSTDLTVVDALSPPPDPPEG